MNPDISENGKAGIPDDAAPSPLEKQLFQAVATFFPSTLYDSPDVYIGQERDTGVDTYGFVKAEGHWYVFAMQGELLERIDLLPFINVTGDIIAEIYPWIAEQKEGCFQQGLSEARLRMHSIKQYVDNLIEDDTNSHTVNRHG